MRPSTVRVPRQRSSPAVPAAVAVLEPFVEAGVLNSADVHLAATCLRLASADGRGSGGVTDDVVLGMAVAARAPRMGHVCVRLTEVGETVVTDASTAAGVSGSVPTGLPWPPAERWVDELLAAPELVAPPAAAWELPLRPFVLEGDRLYLHRYWAYELVVCDRLRQRASHRVAVDAEALEEALSTAFGPRLSQDGSEDLQRRAAEVALTTRLSVIAGGPGTGKTTTVARLIEAAGHLARKAGDGAPRIALAAPTGKAASRMSEAVASASAESSGSPGEGSGSPGEGSGSPGEGSGSPGEGMVSPASTIHRLLGWSPGPGFAHDADNPLEVDLVVIDETSMVDLSLMAHLLEAVPSSARLVLVGDPNQLASVEAGTVLGDIVAAARVPDSALAPNLVELTRLHRYGRGSSLAAVAEAIRSGDSTATLDALRAGSAPVQLRLDEQPPVQEEGPGTDATARLVDSSDTADVDQIAERLAERGIAVVEAARAGDDATALRESRQAKLLAATRRGPSGLYAWTDRIEALVAGHFANSSATLRRGERWPVGRPVLVTANDPVLGVANGDVGVVVAGAPVQDSTAMTDRHVAVAGEQVRHLPTARLEHVEPWWAMTVHKSQGSEFPEVVVSLPDSGSRILSRELLYTAVTRARASVTVIAEEAAVRVAVERPIVRASGLVERLEAPA